MCFLCFMCTSYHQLDTWLARPCLKYVWFYIFAGLKSFDSFAQTGQFLKFVKSLRIFVSFFVQYQMTYLYDYLLATYVSAVHSSWLPLLDQWESLKTAYPWGFICPLPADLPAQSLRFGRQYQLTWCRGQLFEMRFHWNFRRSPCKSRDLPAFYSILLLVPHQVASGRPILDLSRLNIPSCLTSL